MIIYVYSKNDGVYAYSDTGHPKYITQDVLTGFDFTLTPPPDKYHIWRWIDNEWTTEPAI